MQTKNFVVFLIILTLLLAACSSGEIPTAEPETAEIVEQSPTVSPAPTSTPTPEPTPTPVGGATGQFLYTSSVSEKAKMDDGNYLMYNGQQLNWMDLATGESKVLIDKNMMSEEMGVKLYRTRFSPSPDGSQIVVTASTKVTFNSFDEFENYIVSTDLSSMVPILDAGATYVNWIWSPDGTMLLGDTLIDNSRAIYLVNNDGSGLRELARSPVISSPVWSADGSQVYWLLAGYPIATDITTNENNPIVLSGVEGKLIALSFSPDGKQAAFVNDAGKLYIAKEDFSDPQEMDGAFISDSCQGQFRPSLGPWSSDGHYLIVSHNYCLTVNKMLLPKPITSLVDLVSGGSADSIYEDQGTPCGWAPDGSAVFQSETDQGDFLVMVAPGESDVTFSLKDYQGGCPTWIQ